MDIQFKLEDTDFIPLCDLLKATSVCQTGGHAKMVIAEGQVKVDNQVETRKRCKIVANQVVEFEGHVIRVS